MATAKKRVMFIPGERSAVALQRLAAASKQSVAKVVSDLVEANAEQIEGMATACELIGRLNGEQLALVQRAAAAAGEIVLPEVEAVADAWQRLMDVIDNVSQPPAYNMGATSVNDGVKVGA